MAEVAGELLVKVRADIKDLQSKMGKVGKSMNKVDKNSMKTQATFGKLTKAAGVLGVAFGAMQLANFAKDTVKLAAKSQALEKSFASLTNSVGVLGDEMFSTLKQATLGAVSDMELMQSANQALLLGIDPDALPQMFSGAAAVASATGMTITQAIGDITTGIGRQSKLILDNLGIIVDSQKAYDDYAVSLGKTTSELTEQEKKTAFTNKAMEALAKNAKNVGDVSNNSRIKIEKFTSQLIDLKVEFGEALLKGIEPFIEGLIKLMDTAKKTDFENISEELLGIKSPDENRQSISDLADSLISLNDIGTDVSDVFNQSFPEAVGFLGQETGIASSRIQAMTQRLQEQAEQIDLLIIREGVLSGELEITASNSQLVAQAFGASKVATNDINELLQASFIPTLQTLKDITESQNEATEDSTIKLREQRTELINLRDKYQSIVNSGNDNALVQAKNEKALLKVNLKIKAKSKLLGEETIEVDKVIKSSQQRWQPEMKKETDKINNETTALINKNKAMGEGFEKAVDRVLEAGKLINGKTFTFTVFQKTVKQGGVIRQSGGIIHAQGGVLVPGQGTGDKVPAMLESGEFVLNRNAVKSFGLNNLNNLNFRTAPRFQTGGGVGVNGGGTIIVNIEQLNGGDATSIAEALQEQLQDIISL